MAAAAGSFTMLLSPEFAEGGGRGAREVVVSLLRQATGGNVSSLGASLLPTRLPRVLGLAETAASIACQRMIDTWTSSQKLALLPSAPNKGERGEEGEGREAIAMRARAALAAAETHAKELREAADAAAAQVSEAYQQLERARGGKVSRSAGSPGLDDARDGLGRASELQTDATEAAGTRMLQVVGSRGEGLGASGTVGTEEPAVAEERVGSEPRHAHQIEAGEAEADLLLAIEGAEEVLLADSRCPSLPGAPKAGPLEEAAAPVSPNVDETQTGRTKKRANASKKRKRRGGTKAAIRERRGKGSRRGQGRKNGRSKARQAA
ncbi:MAG: hypothetical protein SGPRY_007595 [Prymnesium sp.]